MWQKYSLSTVRPFNFLFAKKSDPFLCLVLKERNKQTYIRIYNISKNTTKKNIISYIAVIYRYIFC